MKGARRQLLGLVTARAFAPLACFAQGAKPTQLPGVSIPQSVLQCADRVIQ